MLISTTTGTLSAYIEDGMTDYEALKTLRDAGYKAVDYSMTLHNSENWETDGALVGQYLKELGILGWQAHCHDAGPIDPDIPLRNLRAEQAIRFCGKAGIKRVVVHPSAWNGNTREQFFEGNYEFYRALIPFCEETGVKVLIENIGNPFDPFYLVNGKDLAELVDGVGSPWFEAVWDTGHANHFDSAENNQYQSIIDLGHRLTAIHFNDNVGPILEDKRHIRMDMHLPPYMSWASDVNYDAIIKGLKDIGYKGTLNFEVTAVEPRRLMQPLFINGEKLDKLAKMPLSVWKKAYEMVYEIGKCMLEAYGMDDK